MMIVFLARFSEMQIFIVRSKGSSPDSTWRRMSMALEMAKSLVRTLRRNCFRVSSMRLARKISWSRVRSGISPICVRYIRTGSSIRRCVSASVGALTAAARSFRPSASQSASAEPSPAWAAIWRARTSVSSIRSTPSSSRAIRMRSRRSGLTRSSGRLSFISS